MAIAIPDRFNCPSCFEPFFHNRAGEELSDEQMRIETVRPFYNHTYHRACLVAWMQACNYNRNTVHCPTCRDAFCDATVLVPDIALVNELIEWRIQNPGAQEEDVPPVPVATPAEEVPEIVAEPDWRKRPLDPLMSSSLP